LEVDALLAQLVHRPAATLHRLARCARGVAVDGALEHEPALAALDALDAGHGGQRGRHLVARSVDAEDEAPPAAEAPRQLEGRALAHEPAPRDDDHARAERLDLREHVA